MRIGTPIAAALPESLESAMDTTHVTVMPRQRFVRMKNRAAHRREPQGRTT